MPEIKRLDQPEPDKKPQVQSSGRISERPKDVQIVGGAPVDRSAPLKVLDKNSPVEDTQAELHIHADRKSFKDAVENDQ